MPETQASAAAVRAVLVLALLVLAL